MRHKRFLKYMLALALLSVGPALPACAQTDVHILDVGQGLSVLIESQGYTMLYDGGDSSHSSYVVSYLKQQGVSKLDYVVASHYDADHLNGIVGALNVFPAETLWGPDYTADSRVFDSFLKISAAKGLNKIQPAPGTEYSVGDAAIQVLAPSGSGYSDVNNYSIAIRVQDGDTSFLITGDAETDSEQEMLSSGLTLDSDVYIMGHHGSGTSNNPEFVQAVSPEYAVVSCAMGNAYGHPHQEAMTAVQSVGARLFRTDMQGNLVASTDGQTITWNTAPCNNYTPGSFMEVPADLPDQPPISETASADRNQKASAPAGISSQPYDGYTIIVNKNSKKYHIPSCRSVRDMKESNKGYCSDAAYLNANGYQPCKNCH